MSDTPKKKLIKPIKQQLKELDRIFEEKLKTPLKNKGWEQLKKEIFAGTNRIPIFKHKSKEKNAFGNNRNKRK